MSKEWLCKKIHGTWADTRYFINCFADAMKIHINLLSAYPDRGQSVVDLCITNYDEIIKEIRKQRRNLVRARYELRKEQENEKNK